MLKQAILNTQNFTKTENGALTLASSKSHVLDLFALAGSANGVDVPLLIQNALSEDPKLALRVIFYLSDIREGQGRRDFFRTALMEVLQKSPSLAAQLVEHIPTFGRWDYLYWFVDTPLQGYALSIIFSEVIDAVSNNRPSLVFKWMASEDASSIETRKNAEITRRFLGLKKKSYRKLLSEGRRIVDVVERKMSAGQWNLIKYESVSAVAMKKYRNAFIKHGEYKFAEFIKKVEKGEAKINASVLYPVDLVKAAIREHNELSKKALVAQWNALKNYVTPGQRIMPMMDTSWSMVNNGVMELAGALAVYLAERAEGEFHNTVMSFSSVAKFFELSDTDTFYEKYNYLYRNTLNETTNLVSAFGLLLQAAVSGSIPAEQMPNRIVVLSDMEFDSTRNNATTLDVIREKYKHYGYEMPQIIFWNLDARTTQSQASKDDADVVMVSGYSPVMLKTVLSDEPYITPYKAMLNVIKVARYDFIDALE